MKEKIDPKQFYTARDAAKLLEVTELTVTKYCRERRLRGKQMGPRRRWHVTGEEILRKLREWGMDGGRG